MCFPDAKKQTQSFTNPTLESKLSQLSSAARAFESSVKESLKTWERAQKPSKQDPHLSTQRRLWVDLVAAPKLLEANVEAMMKKAATATAANNGQK